MGHQCGPSADAGQAAGRQVAAGSGQRAAGCGEQRAAPGGAAGGPADSSTRTCGGTTKSAQTVITELPKHRRSFESFFLFSKCLTLM